MCVSTSRRGVIELDHVVSSRGIDMDIEGCGMSLRNEAAKKTAKSEDDNSCDFFIRGHSAVAEPFRVAEREPKPRLLPCHALDMGTARLLCGMANLPPAPVEYQEADADREHEAQNDQRGCAELGKPSSDEFSRRCR